MELFGMAGGALDGASGAIAAVHQGYRNFFFIAIN
jgi:hypothetical protein